MLSGLALTVIVRLLSSIRNKREDEAMQQNLVVFGLFVILFATWSVLNVFLHFVNFERSLRYVVAFSIPLASSILLKLKKSEITQKRGVSLVLLFLLFLYFGTFTVHSSPLSGSLNMQMSASVWIFHSKHI